MTSIPVKVKFVQIFPRNAAYFEDTDLLRVKFSQTHPPIYRVKVNISIVDTERIFEDDLLISQLISLALTRPASDSFSVSQSKAILSFNLGKKEAPTALDVIQFFIIDKIIRDISKIVDSPALNLTKSPIDLDTSIFDSIGLDQSKPATDSSTVIDQDTLSFIKKNVDITSIVADVTSDFIKSNKELIASLVLIAINTDKVLSDIPNTTDLIRNNFNKLLSDIPIINESPSKNVGKILEPDSISADAVVSPHITKAFFDETTTEELTNLFDGSLYTFIKGINNRAYIAEEFSRIVDYNPLLEDISNINEDPAITFQTPKSDDFFTEDDDTLQFDKGRPDSVDLLDDEIVDFDKAIEEITQIIDDNTIDFSKVTSDTSQIIDNDTLQFDKGRSDSTDLIDDNTIDFSKVTSDLTDLTDNDTLQFDKVTSDSYSVLDNDTLDFNKPVNDTSQLEDDNQIDIEISSSSFDEIISISDNNQVETLKSLSDTAFSVEDSNIFDGSLYTFTKSLSDTVTFVDSPTFVFSDNYSDVFSVIDSEIVDIEISSSGFDEIINIIDSGSLISQGYALEDYFAENYAGSYREF